MLDEELAYYDYKRVTKAAGSGTRRGTKRRTVQEDSGSEGEEADPEVPEMKIYCHALQLPPLVNDHHDASSYGTLRKKLRDLRLTRIFDRKDAPPLDIKALCRPGHFSEVA